MVYHVLNRRVLRLELFEDDGDYLAFIRVLAEAMGRDDAPELFSFCLMPNHWHLLLRPRGDGDLPRWMQWLTVTHTHRWHMHHRTVGTGPVYQGRFKSFPVQDDGHFLTAARYVERNALRANLCDHAASWRWSSFALRSKAAMSDEEASVKAGLATWPVARPGDWSRRVDQPESEHELAALRRSANKGTPLGTDRWVATTVSKLGLESTVRPRGRPKQQEREDDKSS
jgi:putative transposase